MKNKNVLQDISYGMYLVTTSYDGENAGCIVNTLTQVTSDNPIVSINVSKNNYTNEIISKSKKFAVMVLSTDISVDVIGNFGYKTSKDFDKFSTVNYKMLGELPVVFDKMCGYLICDVIESIDCGTHNIIIGKVSSMEKLNDIEPMTYKYYHEVLKGSSPKNAPTYQEDLSNSGDKYKCTICGYVYDESSESVSFDDLPETFKCPICGVGKGMFKKL